MVQNLKTKLVFICLVLIGAAFVFIYKDINLGLDLRGGSTLRYRLPRPTPETPDDQMQQILDDTIQVFRKRVQSYNEFKEIPIRGQGVDEIIINLPGMTQTEVDNVVKIIESQGQLEWMLIAENETDEKDPEISLNITDKQKDLVKFLKEAEQNEKGWDLSIDLSDLNFSMIINGREADYRWLARHPDDLEEKKTILPPKNSTFDSLGLTGIDESPNLVTRYFDLVKRFSDEKWQFGGKDLKSVSASFDGQQKLAVGFEFMASRGSDFAAFTEAHVGKRLAIVLDDQIYSDPVINDILPGSGIISGGGSGFSKDEQKRLITVLRSGSITVRPEPLSEETIGPTLGENSIRRGEIAAMVGLSAVFVFMVVYYLFAGFIAAVALAINLSLLLGVLIFLGATLTLPGIAGIVLTVGMAVDANILIFERIREEKEKGKTLLQSVKNGFERAFVTIVDANATTFITGFILSQFGTGPIKGFATTLMIGICTSLFAALFVSKVFFAFSIEKNVLKNDLKMLKLLANPNIDFPKLMRMAIVGSLILIVAGMVGFFMADDSKYGLDFTGGFKVHVKCKESTTQAAVQNALGAEFPNVEVVSVRKDAASDENDPYTQYAVKIKTTASDIEARRVEKERRKIAAEENPEETENAEPLVDSTDHFLERIRDLLKDDLVRNPFSDLTVVPDEATKTAKVSFGLNLAEATTDTNISDALEGLLVVDKVELSENGLVAKIESRYTKNDEVKPTWIQGRIITSLNASESGIKLLEPFPSKGFIGPTVGKQLRDDAIIAIFFSLVAIIVYIRLRFKEYKYGIAAATALVHDVLITLGVVSVARMMGLVDVEINLPLIAAFLTIIGYSLNDTIVVFDRVRENLPRLELPFPKLLNLSINQTLSRTVLTSLTTLVVVAILFVLNYGQRNVMEGFSFALIVGVIVGTYSSIFVASPMLIWLHTREKKAASK